MRPRRLDELTGQDPTGAGAIPYDQANPVVNDPAAGAAEPDPTQQQAPQAPPMLSQLGGQGAPQDNSTDAMSDVDLASLGAPVDGLQSPEDQQVAQMEAALADPNTSPDERAAIEAQLAIAARRKMAGGLGGLG